MGDKIIFIGRKDSSYFALSLLYRRALEDNKFKRAERSFDGYLFVFRNRRGYRVKITYPVPFIYMSWWFPLNEAPKED